MFVFVYVSARLCFWWVLLFLYAMYSCPYAFSCLGRDVLPVAVFMVVTPKVEAIMEAFVAPQQLEALKLAAVFFQAQQTAAASGVDPPETARIIAAVGASVAVSAKQRALDEVNARKREKARLYQQKKRDRDKRQKKIESDREATAERLLAEEAARPPSAAVLMEDTTWIARHTSTVEVLRSKLQVKVDAKEFEVSGVLTRTALDLV